MSAIITVDDLNTYLKKTLDGAVAAQVTAAVNQYVESQTHRCWGELRTVEDERYDWGNTLWLRNMDVTDITEITLGWPGRTQTSLSSSDYFFNKMGRVTLLGQADGRQSRSAYLNDYVGVSYVYGCENVPDDLKHAALGVAAGFYNFASAGGKEIVSSAVGTYRIETAAAAGNADKPFLNAAAAYFSTIKGYAKQRV